VTVCTACGDCCDPVWYPWSAADIRQAAARGTSRDLVFITAHWRPTGERRHGLHAYACDAFDPQSRLCTAHADRPPICRGYPWYDAPPGSRPVELPVRCAFRADQPTT